jgi:hypothetical protein
MGPLVAVVHRQSHPIDMNNMNKWVKRGLRRQRFRGYTNLQSIGIPEARVTSIKVNLLLVTN